jgi:hypothetical protein
MPFDIALGVKQLDEIIEQGKKSGGSRTGYLQAISLYCSAITRLSPARSSYVVLMNEICGEPMPKLPGALGEAHRAEKLEKLQGVIQSLRDDYVAGRMQIFQELIHADLFSDFLEMAEYFLEEGYKDPAAVMAGGVLEEHLRKLTSKHGITIPPKPQLHSMNSDLAKAGAYGKNEQKQVTAWAGLRNDAAHGNYAKYAIEEIRVMIMGLRDFITRNPA